MNKKNFFVAAAIIWLVCVGSLLGIRYYVHKRPRPNPTLAKAHAMFQSLDSEQKTIIAHYEGAILRLNDESFHLIGLGHESEEDALISNNKVSSRRIDLRIGDPILIERRMMASEAFKTLNNAEKKCLEDGFAAIIFRNGDYCLIFDSKKYQEYVLRYGTECKTCDELRKERTNR
ncbi:MAG: hypothetical protein NT147_04370 [Candidatus Aminicenantes bacterium]|nr:hypothetical protein [Candidatus Aminicenantes bacterium]